MFGIFFGMQGIPQVLLIGPSFSGKSTLAAIWGGQERGSHRVTGNVTVTDVEVSQGDEVSSILVIDSGGTPISHTVALDQVVHVDFIALVFDSTSLRSYGEMKELFKRVDKHNKRMLLIATKTELDSKILGPSDLQVEAFAKENGLKLFRSSLTTAMAVLEWIASESMSNPLVN